MPPAGTHTKKIDRESRAQQMGRGTLAHNPTSGGDACAGRLHGPGGMRAWGERWACRVMSWQMFTWRPNGPGTGLFSRGLVTPVSWALKRFTTVFGMGT